LADLARRMWVAEGKGERAPVPRRTVPCMQTAWPHMLVPRPAAASKLVFPFDQMGVRYRYFARNAVWDAVHLLDLVGKTVLMPAYHHGVELETLLAAGVKPLFYRVDAQMRCDFADAKKRAADEMGLPLIEDCALALLSRDGRDPLGATGDVSVFCLYKTLPVPNGGLLLVRGQLRSQLDSLPPVRSPKLSSTAIHLGSSLLSNLELRAGPAGRRAREMLRSAGRFAIRKASVEFVSTGTQHFDLADVDLGISSLSHLVLRNQQWPEIVERRRRNYFLLYAMLRDVAPPVTGELRPGVCPLFYPMPIANKASAMARLLARGVETVDFWRIRHPAVREGEFPEVDRLRETVLELPVHQDLTPADAEHVATCVRELCT